MTDFATILQLVKSLYFHIPEAGKWCPFRARPHRIGNCRESPPGSVSVSEQTFHQLSRLSVTFRQREATAGNTPALAEYFLTWPCYVFFREEMEKSKEYIKIKKGSLPCYRLKRVPS